MNLDMRAAMLGQAVRAYLAGRGAGQSETATVSAVSEDTESTEQEDEDE